MKAVRIHRFGDADVLRVEDVEMPQPVDDEVLVRVTAASLNPVDTKIRTSGGRFKKEADLPVAMGRDLCGRIEALGTRAHNMLSEGQRLFAMIGFDRGAWADYAVLRATEMAAVPDRLSDEEAAAVPLAGLTAWQGLVDHGGVAAGQRVLIHGGSGGVGHFAVQIAKALGAEVFATASGDGVEFVRSLGADHVIDHRAQRFEDDAANVDVVLDLIGGDTQQRSWDVLAPGGIIVSTLTPPKPQAGQGDDGRRGVDFIVDPKGVDLLKIAAMIEDGVVIPHVQESFALADVAAAARRMEGGTIRGKLVIRVGGEGAA
ncbi:NADPH:quinone reductase-like Zn-dependent oxidoreductase [Sphingomonas jejuensis]|uniref:NADPH:quinone reductase-like Zn-dependent oxidoreductase n=1 Tax=Sphingomonas jejuensis TaxID=904715 RepID=A0ABX0XQI7_9SPHN|nr:NADP-dependent oxidoreductase [Sphingomonas jejuensis]NJC34940.1 NADPH:quinone reductase-like Zn-dependent oxidoreductase [Sphingomonas jejuensis]